MQPEKHTPEEAAQYQLELKLAGKRFTLEEIESIDTWYCDDYGLMTTIGAIQKFKAVTVLTDEKGVRVSINGNTRIAEKNIRFDLDYSKPYNYLISLGFLVNSILNNLTFGITKDNYENMEQVYTAVLHQMNYRIMTKNYKIGNRM